MTLFAGVILATVGVFQFFQGLTAIIKGSFYVIAPNNIYEFSTSGWGWIHLILGIVLAVTGFFILTGQAWARVIGIVVAALSALSNFLFIPYYPIWALVLIALDVAVIWALTTVQPEGLRSPPGPLRTDRTMAPKCGAPGVAVGGSHAGVAQRWIVGRPVHRRLTPPVVEWAGSGRARAARM